ncbi:hypothetical protein [Nonomuraea sp. NPDC002799]
MGTLSEVSKEGIEPPDHGLVSFDFAGPAAFVSVPDQLLFDFQGGPESWGVGRSGDELGAGQIEVALARALGGQAQAVAELEFCLEEVCIALRVDGWHSAAGRVDSGRPRT